MPSCLIGLGNRRLYGLGQGAQVSFQEKYAACWVELILAGRLPDPAARCASFTIVVIPSDFIDFESRNHEQGG